MTNFVGKEAQISHLFLGHFKKTLFLIKTVEATFRQLFEEFGLLLIPTSGHTDRDVSSSSRSSSKGIITSGLLIKDQTRQPPLPHGQKPSFKTPDFRSMEMTFCNFL